jgi:hypothetical protein
MPEYVRIRDKTTGYKYSIVASALDEEHMTVLKQDAVDHNENPLPPEFDTEAAAATSGQQATTKKD